MLIKNLNFAVLQNNSLVNKCILITKQGQLAILAQIDKTSYSQLTCMRTNTLPRTR